jgi:hypothetical protein
MLQCGNARLVQEARPRPLNQSAGTFWAVFFRPFQIYNLLVKKKKLLLL